MNTKEMIERIDRGVLGGKESKWEISRKVVEGVLVWCERLSLLRYFEDRIERQTAEIS